MSARYTGLPTRSLANRPMSHAQRHEHARPLLDRFYAWLTSMMERLSRKTDTSGAIVYALNQWETPMRYCDNGRLEFHNLPVERALRGVAIGRRLYTSELCRAVEIAPPIFRALAVRLAGARYPHERSRGPRSGSNAAAIQRFS